ncbi:UDP-N-acetylmuramoyl-L-alanyl-D-glutamate--2,6-diaminopimelate ligase [Lachnospiraceae bacterium OttesenSCG-928-J05]|nr:UDP-N-acetylmuramoyl-L-alanyl-D-glutamate--2,6-diaminopimelate ligase [Lachnospiraceae bacterium OttesenSCG-928-J05]
MKVYPLKKYLEVAGEYGAVTKSALLGKEEQEVTGLTYNSKEVAPGTLFICKGANFKEAYLQEAKERGAFCYISEKEYQAGAGMSCIIVSDIRQVMARLTILFYNEPAKDLKVIGIGGTKGKTTTAFYLKNIIEQKAPCGILSSICTYDGKTEAVAHNTTPESVELQKYLYQTVQNGVKYMVMEVSSQALKYHRVEGLDFDIGVFLNISEDHISPIEHPDFEDYFQSKMLMFKQTQTAIVNLDGGERIRALEAAKNTSQTITFSLEDETADYYGKDIEKVGEHSRFKAVAKGAEKTYELAMPGLFNIENALAAMAAANALGFSEEEIYTGLKTARVKGRMEIFHAKDGNKIGIVDYAHNKLSFEKLFSSLKKEYPGYRIIAVFGTPGGKAFGRRKDLGEAADRYADEIILTADEPGIEQVRDICEEIGKYIKHKPFQIVEERSQAVEVAFSSAPEKAVIAVVGKGHEASMKIGHEYVDYPSDLELVAKVLKAYDERN